MHLFGFIIRIYCDARSSECQTGLRVSLIVTSQMHSFRQRLAPEKRGYLPHGIARVKSESSALFLIIQDYVGKTSLVLYIHGKLSEHMKSESSETKAILCFMSCLSFLFGFRFKTCKACLSLWGGGGG
jgi:hypothetical protein